MLDASVRIAHLNSGEADHEAATALLLAGTPGQMLVHTITLAEVLVGGVRIGRGASMRDALLAIGIAVAPHDDGEPLRLAELRTGSGLRLPDCCVLDATIHHHATLATLDGQLAGVARRYGVTVEPIR